MKIIVMGLCLFIFSCKSQNEIYVPNPVYQVDSGLASYVSAFYVDGSERNVSVARNIIATINDSDSSFSSSSVIGTCTVGRSINPTVRIKRSFWESSARTELEKYSLIYHELGHCLLDRDHTSANIDLGNNPQYFPVSIMYPYLISYGSGYLNASYSPNTTPYAFMFDNFEGYVDELFGNRATLSAFGVIYESNSEHAYSYAEEFIPENGVRVYEMRIDGSCDQH